MAFRSHVPEVVELLVRFAANLDEFEPPRGSDIKVFIPCRRPGGIQGKRFDL